MSILSLSCIREIANGKGLLMRAGASIPDAAPGSAQRGERIWPESAALRGRTSWFSSWLCLRLF